MATVVDSVSLTSALVMRQSALIRHPAVGLVLIVVAGCQPQSSTDAFFESGGVCQLQIRLKPEAEQQLRDDPRRYVEGTLTEQGRPTISPIRLKIKGNGGSRREFDDRPALTVSLKKSPARFYGLEKFHLNNSVQDESLLHELVASQICAEAGCPTARVTHARVKINDRDLGLYVLKESIDESFLRRHFRNNDGNLYDGNDGQEIDAELERDVGEGPSGPADLQALIDACHESDPQRRHELLSRSLNVEAFVKFMALEQLLGHWDGYTQAHNNYRVYFPAKDHRAQFIPHGLDQVFQDPNYPVFQGPGGMVARAVQEDPQWKEDFRVQVVALLPLFAPEQLGCKIDAGASRLGPAAEAIGEDFARNWRGRVQEFRELASSRQRGLFEPTPPSGPQELHFDSEGWAQVEGWEPRPDNEARLEQVEEEGRNCLLIETSPSGQCAASFRVGATLPAGRYRLEAQVKTVDVVPASDEKGPGGAGLRISGESREDHAEGSSDWQTLAYPIQVTEETRGVELIAELRASAGRALFDLSSLRLVKEND